MARHVEVTNKQKLTSATNHRDTFTDCYPNLVQTSWPKQQRPPVHGIFAQEVQTSADEDDGDDEVMAMTRQMERAAVVIHDVVLEVIVVVAVGKSVPSLQTALC